MAAKKQKKGKGAIGSKMDRLRADYASLLKAMPTVGASDKPPNGLADLAKRVEEAEVLLPDWSLPASAWDKSIYPGDMVAVTREPEKREAAVPLAAGEAALLAAGGVGDAVVSLFAQDGQTWLKAARWSGENWVLGGTTPALERALSRALLIPFPFLDMEFFAVVYPEDSSGMLQFWRLGEDLGFTFYGTDIWTDEDPVNLCGSWGKRQILYRGGGSTYGLLSLGYQGTDGSIKLVGLEPRLIPADGSKGTDTMTGGLYAEKTILPGERAGVRMPNGSTDAFIVPPTDGGIYLSRAWTLTSFTGGVWLTYPGNDGRRYLLELWTLEDHYSMSMDQAEDRRYQYEPGGCLPLLQEGYLPCGACVTGLNVGWPVSCGPVYVGGIARLSGPNQKSLVGVESWVGEYGSKLTPMWFGGEDQAYRSNVGLVNACIIGEKRQVVAIGYKGDAGKYRVLLLGEVGPDRLLGGPSVEVAASVGTAAELVRSGNGAALVWQGPDGSVTMQQLEETATVIPTTDSTLAGGQAVTGGRPGQIVRIKRLR